MSVATNIRKVLVTPISGELFSFQGNTCREELMPCHPRGQIITMRTSLTDPELFDIRNFERFILLSFSGLSVIALEVVPIYC